MRNRQRSFHLKTSEQSPKWVLIDASGKTLGRVASRIASIVRGKDKPSFTPSADAGDFVIVVNAAHITVTGNKLTDKFYYRHSGYPGGLKQESLKSLLRRRPERVIEHAVSGMLPKNRLGRRLLQKIKVYSGPEHPHVAQSPIPMVLSDRGERIILNQGA